MSTQSARHRRVSSCMNRIEFGTDRWEQGSASLLPEYNNTLRKKCQEFFLYIKYYLSTIYNCFKSHKVRRVEHNMPKIWYYGVFSLFHRCRASARLPSQKQKSIHTLCIFGAEQFKTSRFLLKQGTKSPPYCRMARFLTQVRQKYAVLNHIGFNSPHLSRPPHSHWIWNTP